jgi:hypothetical protein
MNDTPILPELRTWDESKLLLAHEMNRLAVATNRLVEVTGRLERKLTVIETEAHVKAKWSGGIWGAIVAVGVTILGWALSAWAKR